MRHYSINRTPVGLWLLEQLPTKTLYLFYMMSGLVVTSVAQLAAQSNCSLSCSGSINVSVNADCMLELHPDQVLSAPPPCPGNYYLTLTTAAGDTLQGNIITQQHIGKTLIATVTHPSSGNSCWGTVLAEDKTPPALSCPDVTLSCNQSTDPSVTGFPQITDNCQTSHFTVLPHNDDIMQTGTCKTDPFLKRTLRIWTVLDAYGNQANCAQMITVMRPKLSDVVFPSKNITLAAGVTATPAVAGQPRINGLPINGVACDMFTNMVDDTLPKCYQKGKLIEYTILRDWIVFDQCEKKLRRDTQFIHVKDMAVPVITCPPATTVGTVIDECYANIGSLPFPMLGNADDSVRVSWIFGNHFGPYSNIPPGIYTLTYTATDCSNASSCTTTITIKDSQTPTPILIGNQVVSIPSSGSVTLSANHFNVASYDNCDAVQLTVSRDGVVFGHAVTFTCADVGAQVMVSVRVSEVNNPSQFTIAMVGISIQDKQAPMPVPGTIPPNITVDCEYDYLHPTLGGAPYTPVFTDNCGVDTVILSIQNTVNACGSGVVLRTFTAWDIHGNSTRITQRITVQNQTPFTPDRITWPLNYTTQQCGASLDVQDIPQPFREPVIQHIPCSMVAVNFKDQVFNAGNSGCSKILRRWTVVDWCQYDPNQPHAGGSWSYTQVLQVMDGQAPGLTTPNDITVSVGNDCQRGYVSLPDAQATDCSNLLTISHNSPHADAPGANISGNYPLGTTHVTIRASDGCGNVTQKVVKITVLDNVPPTALCMNGLSASLTMMDNGPGLMVSAQHFDAGSFDLCTPKNQLKLSVKVGNTNAAPSPGLSFSCSDVGFQLIELHVTDSKGNTGKCLTYLLVQDNAKICPSNNTSPRASISGCIETEKSKKVEGVSLKVPNYQLAVPVNTDAAGLFAIPDLPMYGNYNIQPIKDGDDLNGVTSYDLLLLSRHILGVQPLTSPYQIIAADANNSKTITSADILELRKLLLGIYDSLPKVSSWRFVDKNFIFPDVNNPFATPFPEMKSIVNLAADSTAHFIGIKIGDLNSSAITHHLNAGNDRNESGTVSLISDDLALQPGESFSLPIAFAQSQELGAMAFTLQFDPHLIEIEDGMPGTALPALSDGNMSFHAIQNGIITFCWADANGAAVQAGQMLMLLKGKARTKTHISEAFRLTHQPTRLEAFGLDGEQWGMTWRFESLNPDSPATPAEKYALWQNQPNPFHTDTRISFQVPAATRVTMTVFDAAGRQIYESQQLVEKGTHEWQLPAHIFHQRGVYFCQIATDDWLATRKMVKL